MLRNGGEIRCIYAKAQLCMFKRRFRGKDCYGKERLSISSTGEEKEEDPVRREESTAAQDRNIYEDIEPGSVWTWHHMV
jgi:hypothetical protein